jgi:hypothetical protein
VNVRGTFTGKNAKRKRGRRHSTDLFSVYAVPIPRLRSG